MGLIGSAIELLLLKHTDGALQVLPLGLIGLALVALAWYGLRSNPLSRTLLQLVMLLFLLSGVAGVLLHYRGNVEWELERMPGTGGWELFRHAIMGATPALAPGVMLHLGLVGLLFIYLQPRPRSGMDS